MGEVIPLPKEAEFFSSLGRETITIMQPVYRLSVDGRLDTALDVSPYGSLGICAPGSGCRSQVPASVPPSRLSLEAAYPTGFAPVPFSEVLTIGSKRILADKYPMATRKRNPQV